jgi:hypothetical protein
VLARLGNFQMRRMQKRFARESSAAMLRAVNWVSDLSRRESAFCMPPK